LPSRFASCEGCRDLLDHHIRIQADVVHDPNILVAAAVAHCAALSVPDDPQRKRDSYLKEITLDPSYLWVPAATRAIIIAWARDTFTAQQAATVETFLELPDDCGGDVLEFLDTKMTRKELLHAATQVMSQEAIAWVRAVIDAAVAAVVAVRLNSILMYCPCFQMSHSSLLKCRQRQHLYLFSLLKWVTLSFWRIASRKGPTLTLKTRCFRFRYSFVPWRKLPESHTPHGVLARLPVFIYKLTNVTSCNNFQPVPLKCLCLSPGFVKWFTCSIRRAKGNLFYTLPFLKFHIISRPLVPQPFFMLATTDTPPS